MSTHSPKNHTVLRQIQGGLEQLYRLAPAPDIIGYLVDKTDDHPLREELILVEKDDLQIGVIIDPNAVQSLHTDILADDNLEQFCLAVEGISHFLFIIDRAREERSTSAFELELQAEVDKFVAGLFLARRSPKLAPRQLRNRLYQNYHLAVGLNRDEQHRYQNANSLAQRYARRLDEAYVRTQKLTAMVQELRRFYRMSCWAKQDHIAKAA